MGFESRAISARVTKQIVTIFSKTCDNKVYNLPKVICEKVYFLNCEFCNYFRYHKWTSIHVNYKKIFLIMFKPRVSGRYNYYKTVFDTLL